MGLGVKPDERRVHKQRHPVQPGFDLAGRLGVVILAGATVAAACSTLPVSSPAATEAATSTTSASPPTIASPSPQPVPTTPTVIETAAHLRWSSSSTDLSANVAGHGVRLLAKYGDQSLYFAFPDKANPVNLYSSDGVAWFKSTDTGSFVAAAFGGDLALGCDGRTCSSFRLVP